MAELYMSPLWGFENIVDFSCYKYIIPNGIFKPVPVSIVNTRETWDQRIQI